MSFEKDFEEMRKRIDRMLKDFFRGRPYWSGTPVGRGAGKKRRPRDAEQRREGESMSRVVEGKDPSEREPVYDVIAGEEDIFITVELPGTTPEKISLRASERALTVEAQGYRRYWKILEMPEPVETSSLTWTFNNGVLDITITKQARSIRAD
ncbi:MAG: Hsp20/alpha crystallin family protein [Candidatus Thermoplasmatota archaeon]|nr:Hsp20/alpha crystallin family protein [Candidatus Thermoplasmatota archaeon]